MYRFYQTKDRFNYNKTFNFINAIENKRTLFVGEGNFSFCLSIAQSIYNPQNIIATTLEDRIDFTNFTLENIIQLQNLGVKIYTNTDAMQIHKSFQRYRFDNIIFQFPHTGECEDFKNENSNFLLLKYFLLNAKNILNYQSKVMISIVDSPYYRSLFQIDKVAKIIGFQNISVYEFNPLHFSNYIHTMTNENESAIEDKQDFITIVFEL